MIFTKINHKYFHEPGLGHFENCATYHLLDKDRNAGLFICNSKAVFIKYLSMLIKIDIPKTILQGSGFEIIDTVSEIKMGRFDLPAAPLKKSEIGMFYYKNIQFEAERIMPGSWYSFFKKETLGYYEMLLYNNSSEIKYKLKINTPKRYMPDTEFQNAAGEIETNETDIIIVLCGFFMLERMLHNIDLKSI